MAEAGVSYNYAGQNIGRGYPGADGPEGVIKATVRHDDGSEQPPADYHRQAIMCPNYRTLGVGIAFDSEGRLYWVCNFAG
jgi:uncharacterized protein YkwD